MRIFYRAVRVGVRSHRTAAVGPPRLTLSLRPADVDLPPFEVDSDVLPPLAAHVRLARQINLAEHRLRRDAGARGWHQRAAEQMDLELDSDLL